MSKHGINIRYQGIRCHDEKKICKKKVQLQQEKKNKVPILVETVLAKNHIPNQIQNSRTYPNTQDDFLGKVYPSLFISIEPDLFEWTIEISLLFPTFPTSHTSLYYTSRTNKYSSQLKPFVAYQTPDHVKKK